MNAVTATSQYAEAVAAGMTAFALGPTWDGNATGMPSDFIKAGITYIVRPASGADVCVSRIARYDTPVVRMFCAEHGETLCCHTAAVSELRERN